MAKSSAKKVRDKAVREGTRNPECNRSPFVFSDMRTRKTKTKKINYTGTNIKTVILMKAE